MIQRIQTLHLLIAAVLMTLVAFLPVAEFVGVDGAAAEELQLTAFGLKTIPADGAEAVTVVKTIAMGIVIAVAAALPFITIFLFKKRMLQFRLCASELILLIGAQVFEVFYLFRSVRGMEEFANHIYSLKLPFFFPLIAILFVWLAMKGITKDIKLVKSLDRIR